MNRSHPNRIPSMRAGRVACAFALALAMSASFASQAMAVTFTFNGAGFGHGIGLSQYGAKGWAEHGKLGESIATYYYPGTKIGSVANPIITVNVDPAKNVGDRIDYTRSSWRLRAGDGKSGLLINGISRPYTGNGIYTFTGYTSAGVHYVRVTKPDGSYLGQWATLDVKPTGGSPALVEVVDGSGIYNWTRIRYRGHMNLKVNSSNLVALRNVLPINDYVKGVVPRESPASWHPEALKAQAIVARSYAYATRANKPEMYCTTWDQAYAGHSRYVNGAWLTLEHAPSADATAGKYVMYGSTVVQTFFSSSAGNHTATLTDVWQGGSTAPYYKGVPDPYCQGWNPWGQNALGHDYPRAMSGMTLAALLAPKLSSDPAGAGTSVSVQSLRLDTAASGYVRNFDINWSNGSVSSDVDGDLMRSALGLPSTKFTATFGGPYTRIWAPDRYSTAVAISKKAFPTPGPAVAVLVNGSDDKFADSLTSSALGGVAGGPVLLATSATLPEATRAELQRLKPQKLYVVGGTASVSAAVLGKALAAAGLPSATRLGGADRYGVASAVALEIGRLSPATANKAMIASGEKWPDAAIGSVVAALSHRPLLLVNSRGVPSVTASTIKSLGVTQTAVFGGETTLPSAVISALCSLTGESAPYKRFGVGGSRYDEAVSATNWCTTEKWAERSTVYIASGETFPDSVVGGVLAARGKHPLLLTTGQAPARATMDYLLFQHGSIYNIVILGGPGSVSNDTASQLGGAAY